VATGIKLVERKAWDVVLDDLVAAVKLADSECERVGRAGIIHKVDAVVESPILGMDERRFSVLVSTLMASDGLHYMLFYRHS